MAVRLVVIGKVIHLAHLLMPNLQHCSPNLITVGLSTVYPQ